MKNNIVSLCLIVKNEEECLERCLKSVKNFADEIIIVDTGSTDNTKQIAKKFTNKIFDFVWINNFSAARNYAFSKATGKYIMWLDADDYISPENNKKLIKLKQNLTGETDVYMLKYEIAFDNMGKSTFTYNRERIVKNNGTFFWEGAVHEAITPHGKIDYVDIAIKHLKKDKTNPKRNLRIYQNLLKQGKSFSPREQYYYSRELYYNLQYKKAITELNRFLKMENGWIEDKLGALEIKALCEINLNKTDKALNTLYKSFSLDYPRANFLCLIGDILLMQNKINESIFWYKNAINSTKNYNSDAFINESYYGIYPALQLCLAYYKLGDIKMSQTYNNLALTLNQKNEIAVNNAKFFDSLKSN